MRAFINLFFTIVLPVSLLSIIITTLYFLIDYNLTKSIRLGTLNGVFGGIGLAFFITLSLLIFRKIHSSASSTHKQSKESSPAVKKNVTPQSEPLNKTLMLLMDKEIAFEVSLHTISDQKIGEIINHDKQKGSISIRTKEGTIDITITALTKHTSEVMIKTDHHIENIQNIINYLKAKEHSFMDY